MIYQVWGKVIHGKNRGKYLGFPTANLILHKNIPEGVYASNTKFNNAWYRSLCFIGTAKTFAEAELHAESHIFHFNNNIYGKWISIHLLKKIRNNQKFTSKEKLIKQLKNDKKEALKYFNLHTQ